MIQNTVIQVKNLSKSFTVGVQAVAVLKNINLEVKAGDFLIIFGPSGCGKSTLLHTILGLEQPTSGSVIFLGVNLYPKEVSSIKYSVSGMKNEENKNIHNTKYTIHNTYSEDC